MFVQRQSAAPAGLPVPGRALGWAALGAVIGVLAGAGAAAAGGELFGAIRTDDGKTYTGAIRWDKNENFWDDILDAQKDKEVPGRKTRQDVRIFGIQISRLADRHRIRSEFSVPFGHIRSIEPVSGDRAVIVLKSGEKLTVRESSDMGGGMRGIEIDDESHGPVKVDWHDVESIAFSGQAGPGRDAERLYGTVTTGKARFTGFVVWDRDESLQSDVLDGEEDGRNYKVPFSKIVSIEKEGRRASLVTLDSGREVRLSGTNDVDDDNRGITVTVPGVGSVEVDWDAFRRVDFSPAPPSLSYDAFDGGRELRGTVTAADGRSYRGRIIWDNDEEYSFEPLDGEAADADFAILFENIATIRRLSSRAATVTLRNGDVYVLEGTNDVDDGNKGIVILSSPDEEVRLGWDEFAEASFDGR